MSPRIASSLVVLGVLLLAGCATGTQDAAPEASTPAPSSSAQPTQSPASASPGQITVGADSVEVTRDGATTAYPLDGDGAEILAVMEELAGSAPLVTEVDDPWGNGELWGHRYEWSDVVVAVIQDRTSVQFLAPSVGTVPVTTVDGITIGSTLGDVTAAGASDVWDEDSDGVAEHLALSAVPVPGTVSLSRPGEVGMEYIAVTLSGDSVSMLSVPANDYSDI